MIHFQIMVQTDPEAWDYFGCFPTLSEGFESIKQWTEKDFDADPSLPTTHTPTDSTQGQYSAGGWDFFYFMGTR